MKLDKIIFKEPSFSKQQFLKQLERTSRTSPYRPLLTPGEASKVTFTASGTSLQVNGPPALIERLARKLKGLGAKAEPTTPNGTL
jgi:hypothetical protein